MRSACSPQTYRSNESERRNSSRSSCSKLRRISRISSSRPLLDRFRYRLVQTTCEFPWTRGALKDAIRAGKLVEASCLKARYTLSKLSVGKGGGPLRRAGVEGQRGGMHANSLGCSHGPRSTILLHFVNCIRNMFSLSAFPHPRSRTVCWRKRSRQVYVIWTEPPQKDLARVCRRSFSIRAGKRKKR